MLKDGFTSEALEDFTGGVIQSIEIKKEARDDLWRMIDRGINEQSLFACSFKVGVTSGN